jgi:hypothetical protein
MIKNNQEHIKQSLLMESVERHPIIIGYLPFLQIKSKPIFGQMLGRLSIN